jgi:type I restriction enzyme S subunit
MRKGWDYKKLGEVAAYITDGDWIESKDQSDSGIRLIQTGNVGNGVFKLKDDKPHYISEETFSRIGCIEIFEGDCLISRLPDPIGRACVIPNIGCRMITAVDCSIIRFNDNYLPQFFVYYTQSSNYRIGINNYTTGSTRKRISRKNLENVSIPVPSLAEQQSVVSELDKINELISLKKAQLSDLDTLAQSIFYEMFGDINNTSFEIKTLNDVCEFIKDGTHQTPKYTEDAINGVKFLSAKDVVSGYINWANIKYIPQEIHAELYKRIAPKRGDILLCKNGTTGISAVVDTDDIFDIYVSLALLRPKSGCLPEYLHYAINNPYTKRQFDDSLKGIGVPNLHLGEIKRTAIIFPPLPLQQSFARKIEAIEQQKTQITATIKDLETLLASRMQYWFD